MGKKHIFPLHLFLFFEQVGAAYWTSDVLKPNHAVTFWPAHTAAALAHVLKLETQLAPSFLVESSGADTSGFNGGDFALQGLWAGHPLLYFNLHYFYHIKFKITFCALPRSTVPSVSAAYENAVWLEREASEMLGLGFSASTDCRNLLLDYAASAAPLARHYPCVGEFESFYSPLDEGFSFARTSSAEL